MKKIFFLLFIISSASFSFAQKDDYIDVDSKINDVTVFLRGAQIQRSGSKAINPGVSKLRFSYLSPDIDPNSIKVSGNGAFTILSVSHSIDHLREGRTHAKVKLIEDSIQRLEDKIHLNNDFITALNEEWNMVIANKQVNNNTGFDIEDVDDLAIYYRNRLRKIAIERQQLKRNNSDLKKIQTKLINQKGELNAKWNKSTSEVIIEVSAKSRTTARINLSYVVRNAGWIPNYDIRVKDSNSPITLNYKAKVYQNSGVDWDNVKLSLSTGNPMKNATKPTLYPWRLYFQNNHVSYNNQKYDGRNKGYAVTPAASLHETSLEYVNLAEDEAAKSSAQFTQMTESQVNTTFDISIPYTINSDGKYHDVNIQTFELPAQYRYFAAPKLDLEAFLLAKVTGWDKLNLLPGEANIFFEGTYTGKSTINPNETKDTLDLSLGRDPGIVINREKIDEYSKTQIVGSNKTDLIGIKITVKNTKSTNVVIDLTDQLPISTSKEIEVETIEISGAKLDEINNYLNWEVNLSPGETKSFILKYSVKYPKDKKLNL